MCVAKLILSTPSFVLGFLFSSSFLSFGVVSVSVIVWERCVFTVGSMGRTRGRGRRVCQGVCVCGGRAVRLQGAENEGQSIGGRGRRQDSAGGGVCEAHCRWESTDSHEVGRAEGWGEGTLRPSLAPSWFICL